MLFSQAFIPTAREAPKSAESKSHILSLRSGLLFMASAGIYSYLPLGYKILRKIEDIIRKHMDANGAQELFMSALQPLDIWKKTGRDKDLAEVIFKFDDRKERTLVLGPTHEELITEIVKKHVFSYKQLPIILYQIQAKFRDEMRPRYGLVRSCEFMMKDAYSFDVDREGLNASYEKMFCAYKDIFSECGLRTVISEADPGAMGGSTSHEFLAPAEIGEDTLFCCPDCGDYHKDAGKCKKCAKSLRKEPMIEVGHVFKLGTKYSQAQGVYVLGKEGERTLPIMGCYGIGVSRLISAIIEQNNDEKGIMWPKSVSGFDITLVVASSQKNEIAQESLRLYETLKKCGFDVLMDERSENLGVKINDAYLIGNPYIIIMGKKYLESRKFEVEKRASREKLFFSQEELINFLKAEYAG